MAENTEKQTLPEGITHAMVQEAINKYGKDKVRLIGIPVDDESTDFKWVLATVPSRSILGQYRRWVENDPKKADEILVKNCLLSHKDEVLANDGLFYGALNGITELIPVRKSVVKNL